MDISVCIVNWNTRELLSECLRSIKEKTSGGGYEVIVVDNASTDGSAQMVRKGFPWVRLIESPVNLGFVRGNNLAVRHSSGKYVLYLNPDTRLVTNALYGLFRFLEGNSGYGAAGCRLVGTDGRIQYTCASAFPTPLNELSRLMLLNRVFRGSRLFSSRELDYWDHRESRGVECLSGACMMVRRDLIERIGGFDEGLYMYAEDMDLCFRIQKAGLRIYYLSSEVIIHHEGAGARKKKSRNFAALLQSESNLYFIKKHGRPGCAPAYRLAVAAGSVFRVLAAVSLFPVLAVRSMAAGKESATAVVGKYLSLFLWSIGALKARKLI